MVLWCAGVRAGEKGKKEEHTHTSLLFYDCLCCFLAHNHCRRFKLHLSVCCCRHDSMIMMILRPTVL